MNEKPPARLGQTPGLIGMRGPQPTMGGATLGIFTPFAALEPDQPRTERTMVSLVSKLNRDDALLMCGFLNCVTSGSGLTDDLERQRNAYAAVFAPDDAAKIDTFIAEHRAANRITLFFRGQLLELMRWVARHADAAPGDGRSFSSLETRRTFVRAAFLAAHLWAIDQAQVKRIFPVLVVHDERMGSPGVGVFLNRIFAELLGDVGKRVLVAPLTVMTIHDLENIESSHAFTLRELLAAYVARSGGGMVSVHNFMATDDEFKTKVRPSDALMRKSYELVGQMHGQLFPPAEQADLATEGA